MLLATALLGAMSSSHQGNFSRHPHELTRLYRTRHVAVYRLSYNSGSTNANVDIQTTVKGKRPGGAILEYRMLHLYMSDVKNPPHMRALLSTVGPSGMPDDASINSNFYLFLSVAGAVPTGQTGQHGLLAVHWKNRSKDLSLDGAGEVVEHDRRNNSLVVAWRLTFHHDTEEDLIFKVTSVYSMDDLSLLASKGVMVTKGDEMPISVRRLARGRLAPFPD